MERAQWHASGANGQPQLAPAPPKAVAGFNAPRGRAGGNPLTWESLEEMSFEDLLSLDARAAFSHLPPLPSMGERIPSPQQVKI